MVKVKSLYLTKHHAMKTYWGSGGIVPTPPRGEMFIPSWSLALEKEEG